MQKDNSGEGDIVLREIKLTVSAPVPSSNCKSTLGLPVVSRPPWGWAFAVGLVPFAIVMMQELGRACSLDGVHFYWTLVFAVFVAFLWLLVQLLGLLLWLIKEGAKAGWAACVKGSHYEYSLREDNLRPNPTHVRLSEAEMGRLQTD